MKIGVTVVYPVHVEIDFDVKKIMDDEYIQKKRQEALETADINFSMIFKRAAYILDSGLPVMVERHAD